MRKSLGRFRPTKPMPGKWGGILALGLVAGSMVVHEMVGAWPAIVFVGLGIHAGRRGLDSRARGFALTALILGMIFLIFYVTRIIVGDSSVTPEPLAFFR